MKSVRVLNRVVTWGDKGLIYEADQRHAEIIVRDLGLRESKPVGAPGLADRGGEDPTELSGEQATKYRALVARAIYLAQDRPELAYAAKELSRRMARPTEGAWSKLKRFGRYVV